MATIRNKSLLRSLEHDRAESASTSNGNSSNHKVVRQVPVSDLKKVSRAISILQQSNATLAKLVNNLHMYYERKYKSKVLELQTALQLKTQTIAQIEKDFVVEYLFVVKIQNCVYLLDDFERVNKYLSENQDCRVVLCYQSRVAWSVRS
ncbi:Unknown (Se28) [Spodoptera exigua multiple nucleopolyhedrovirus]|nr:Unknown (Se28) [Spodoptera exigua multiple nucleopolyhedrovirus]